MRILGILTLIIGYFVYLTYKPYLLDIAIASLMAIAFGKVIYFLSLKIKNRYLLSSLVTGIFALLIFGPILYFTFKAGSVISQIDINEIKNILIKSQHLVSYLPSFIQDEVKNYLTPDHITQIYNAIMPIVGTLTAKSAVFFKDAFLIVIFFFFAVLYGKEILLFLQKVIPLENEKLEKIFFGTSEVMSVVFYSTVLTALLEGVLFGFIVSMYGLNFMFFTVMYAFASLIPVVGGVLMWGPVSLYLYANDNTEGAVVVALYSIIMISIVADTFIKPIIIDKVKDLFKGEFEVNSLLIFFSIVAGLSSFGLWGIIIGPAVTAMFLSVIKFYENIERI
jgi:predicted PurR-regulated permease PerM